MEIEIPKTKVFISTNSSCAEFYVKEDYYAVREAVNSTSGDYAPLEVAMREDCKFWHPNEGNKIIWREISVRKDTINFYCEIPEPTGTNLRYGTEDMRF